MRFLAVALMALSLALPGSAAMRPIRLRCEFLTNPIGIDAAAPLLNWELQERHRA